MATMKAGLVVVKVKEDRRGQTSRNRKNGICPLKDSNPLYLMLVKQLRTHRHQWMVAGCCNFIK